MLNFKNKYRIFNPLEQFEINEFYLNLSDFFKHCLMSDNVIKKNTIFFFDTMNNNLFNIHNFFFEIDQTCYFNFFFNFFFFNDIIYTKSTYYLIEFFASSNFFILSQLLILLLLFPTNIFMKQLLSPVQFFIFSLTKFVTGIVKNVNTNVVKYIPYLFSLFLIILLFNILGLIPFVKSLTSTLSITFFLAISSFFGLNIEGTQLQKINFFSKFAPGTVPFSILPLLVIIELISYFMRPNSLAIRLFSNMLAGHILIKLFISFCLDLTSVSLFIFICCFLFICILITLEVFISFLQAYIFMLLVLLYLNEVLNSSH